MTADGSAATDDNPRDAELDNLLLFCREAAVALRVLRPGGAFVLKLFDVAEARTHRLLAVVARAFERTSLVKPLTSRATNGEVYVLAQGFLADGATAADVTALRGSGAPLADAPLGGAWRACMSDAHQRLANAQLQALRALFAFLDKRAVPSADASRELWERIRPPFAAALAADGSHKRPKHR